MYDDTLSDRYPFIISFSHHCGLVDCYFNFNMDIYFTKLEKFP